MTMAESLGWGGGDVGSGFSRYPKYRDSGVGWLGEVPEHWEVQRLKTLSEMRSGESITSKSIRDSGPYPVYGGNGLRGYTSRFTHDGAHLLIGRQGALCGNVHVVHGRFWASEHAVVVTPDQPGVVAWFGAVLAAMDLNQYSVAAAQPGLAVDRLRDLHVPVPPDPEKQTIADFLGRETAKIGGLLAKKHCLVELLREERTALIGRAVTRGLEPDAPTRETGIEWLGPIPVHWELPELGRIGDFRKGRGGTKLDESETGIPCVRYGDLYTCHDHFVHRARSCVTPEVAGDYTSLRYGDVLFAASGETVEDIGKSAVNLLRSEAVCGGAIILFRSQRDCVPGFMGYAMDAPHAAYQKATMGRGFTVAHIYIPQLRQLRIPLPPPREQRMIADHLNRETRKLDALIEKIGRAIDRLLEYRNEVISAAITGRIDVRPARSPEHYGRPPPQKQA